MLPVTSCSSCAVRCLPVNSQYISTSAVGRSSFREVNGTYAWSSWGDPRTHGCPSAARPFTEVHSAVPEPVRAACVLAARASTPVYQHACVSKPSCSIWVFSSHEMLVLIPTSWKDWREAFSARLDARPVGRCKSGAFLLFSQ